MGDKPGQFTTREIASLLDFTPRQIYYFVGLDFLKPERGDQGEYRFSFLDIVLLRAAKGLIRAGIPVTRIKDNLDHLREQLPPEKPLTAVKISVHRSKIVVQDAGEMWYPESGQILFNFEVADLAAQVSELERMDSVDESSESAEDWYLLGCEREDLDPGAAREAYQKALQLNPEHVEANLNLGRLFHEAEELEKAEKCYRLALGYNPSDSTAWYNLGVVLEDLKRASDAKKAYLRALQEDADLKEAHFNLARLYESEGRENEAFRHLTTYKRLKKST